MMKNIFILLVISTMSFSCNQAEAVNAKEGAVKNENASEGVDTSKKQAGTVKITGDMTNASNKNVYFSRFVDKIPSDTAQADANGHFELNVKVDVIDYYKLYFDQTNSIALIIGPTTSHVQLKGDANNFPNDYTVSGSKDSELMQVFFTKNRDYLAEKNTLVAKVNAAKDMTERKRLQDELMAVNRGFSDGMKELALQNPSSPAALSMIYNLNPREYMDVFDKVMPELDKVMGHSELYTGVKKELNQFKAKQQEMDARKAMENSLAPDIILNDPNGKTIKLSSLRGKYVLVDFWASWCGPCRRENPNVVKLYEKYKDKGFEILGVSLDKDKKRWVDAIAKDGLKWKHVSDLGGWNSSVVPKYGITSIPHTVLIDKKGNIIEAGLRGPELAQKLQELMGF